MATLTGSAWGVRECKPNVGYSQNHGLFLGAVGPSVLVALGVLLSGRRGSRSISS